MLGFTTRTLPDLVTQRRSRGCFSTKKRFISKCIVNTFMRSCSWRFEKFPELGIVTMGDATNRWLRNVAAYNGQFSLSSKTHTCIAGQRQVTQYKCEQLLHDETEETLECSTSCSSVTAQDALPLLAPRLILQPHSCRLLYTTAS